MLDETTAKGRIVAAALRLAAERPWEAVGLRDIAAAAGMNLAELRREVSSKEGILAAFIRAIDDEVLAAAPNPVDEENPRDVLFDVIMRRFDALAPYRAALKSIAASPSVSVSTLRAMAESQAWMLRAAGIATEGVLGPVRVAGLAAIHGQVFGTWLEDDDAGLARTMAALDRRLRRGERILGSVDAGLGWLRQAAARGRTRPPRAKREAPSDAPET